MTEQNKTVSREIEQALKAVEQSGEYKEVVKRACQHNQCCQYEAG